MGAEVTACNKPIGYNSCVECMLCVSACPVGAIGADVAGSIYSPRNRHLSLPFTLTLTEPYSTRLRNWPV